jgi:hypothetical protein
MGPQATTGTNLCTSQARPAVNVPRIPDARAASSAVIMHFISGILVVRFKITSYLNIEIIIRFSRLKCVEG